MMTPGIRKLALTTHITFSVGWFGAVAGFLVLATVGLASLNMQMARSAYLAMELVGWFVIVPFCVGCLLTGLTQSLGTEWGLFRHYWVAVKLILTVIATIVLFLHMRPISYLAEIASQSTLSSSQLRGLRIQLIADAGAALLVLLIATTLSVYKPWGRINYGRNTGQNHMGTAFQKSKTKKIVGTLRVAWADRFGHFVVHHYAP